MDLGGTEVDGFNGFRGGYDAGFDTSDHEVYGSGMIAKQGGRFGDAATEEDLSSIKMVKSSSDYEISATEELLLQLSSNGGLGMRSDNARSNSGAFFSDARSQMLCFSSSEKAEEDAFLDKTSQSTSLPYSLRDPSPVYGYNNTGSVNNRSNFASLGGPFTKCQWMELEKQALMYKYIIANIPIPSNLLNPIKKTLDSLPFQPLSASTLRSTTLGWGGSFQLGIPHGNDPEPGRCRRTDGKKWRCSRDAVCDQKYCDRHINRGRHRSRKPVENPTAPYSTTKNNTTTIPLHHGSATLLRNFQQIHDFNPLNTSATTHLHSCRNKENDEYMGDLSIKSKPTQLPHDSLLYPSQHTFIDNSWPKTQPDYIGMQSNHTNLSIDNQKQGNWGPLGEALHGNSSNNDLKSGWECKKLSGGVNLMMDVWEGCPWVGSSLTGVLQKTALGSLSNSSDGSSPRPESGKNCVAKTLFNNLLGGATPLRSASQTLL